MKQFAKWCFTFCSYCFVFVFFAAALTPYISPLWFWPMSFLALGFPYLALGMLFLIFVWFFIRKKTALVFCFVLLTGYKNLLSTITWHCTQNTTKQPKETIRILSWNVRGFDNPSTYIDSPGSVRQQMFNYIKLSNPDIICTQEFTEHNGKGLISNTTELLDMGYAFNFRTNELSHLYPYGLVQSGTAIFSKLPITNSGKIMYADSSFPEHIAYIDVKMKNKMCRIFSTHFKSYNFSAVEDVSNKAKFYGDSTFIYRASKFEKLRTFSKEHVVQSNKVKEIMRQSPYPFVFCADLNDVPTSYSYHIISKGLQDAFLQRGCGTGGTMDSMPPTLRIDYLLADKSISINNYQLNKMHLSDHYPQIIDISWKQ